MRQHRAIAATLTKLLKQGGAQVDTERPAPQMCEFETNDEGERVVKDAIFDLVSFPEQLCAHWIAVSVRALVAERYTPVGKMLQPALRYHGRGGQVETLQGQGTPNGDGNVWNLLAMTAGQTARSRPAPHVRRDRLRRALWYATAECRPASVGQSSGAGGARVSGVPAREHPVAELFVRARCVCDVTFLQCVDLFFRLWRLSWSAMANASLVPLRAGESGGCARGFGTSGRPSRWHWPRSFITAPRW